MCLTDIPQRFGQLTAPRVAKPVASIRAGPGPRLAGKFDFDILVHGNHLLHLENLPVSSKVFKSALTRTTSNETALGISTVGDTCAKNHRVLLLKQRRRAKPQQLH